MLLAVGVPGVGVVLVAAGIWKRHAALVLAGASLLALGAVAWAAISSVVCEVDCEGRDERADAAFAVFVVLASAAAVAALARLKRGGGSR